ncbi:MAG: hypothetical protein AB4290_13985 [Spirulina sp.]
MFPHSFLASVELARTGAIFAQLQGAIAVSLRERSPLPPRSRRKNLHTS